VTAKKGPDRALVKAKENSGTVEATALARQAAKLAQEALINGWGAKPSMIEELLTRFHQMDETGEPVMADKDRLLYATFFERLSQSRALTAASMGLNRFAIQTQQAAKDKPTHQTNIFISGDTPAQAMDAFLAQIDPSRRKASPPPAQPAPRIIEAKPSEADEDAA